MLWPLKTKRSSVLSNILWYLVDHRDKRASEIRENQIIPRLVGNENTEITITNTDGSCMCFHYESNLFNSFDFAKYIFAGYD